MFWDVLRDTEAQNEAYHTVEYSDERVPLSYTCHVCNKLFFSNKELGAHKYTQHWLEVPIRAKKKTPPVACVV